MNWQEDEHGYLKKKFSFKNYRQSFAFTSQIALLAEKKNHHPQIILDYKQVTVRLISHDVGSVTERDIDMASLIDKLSNI